MYWFFADETNVQPTQGMFFIYGGLIATPDQMVSAHEAVKEIRSNYGFKDSDKFRFQTASRPEGIEPERWSEAKAAALKSAQEIGLQMIAYVIHHGIAKKDATVEYALNTLVAHFDMRYLREKDDFGALCIDRIDEQFGYRYMRERFQNPLDLPDGRSVELARVIHYSMSCDGASHISSLVDLAVGGFRYCVNTALGQGKREIAEEVIRPIANMMWGVQQGGKYRIGGYGLVKRPLSIKVETYKQDYDTLTRMLGEYSNKPTGQVE